MRPKQPKPQCADMFRNELVNIIDPRHALLGLAKLLDWERLDAEFGALYAEKGRPGVPTRLMAGIHLLKHMKGVSDEVVCAMWVENPYFQAFCGEKYFQHQLPFDRTSMSNWRARIIRLLANWLRRLFCAIWAWIWEGTISPCAQCCRQGVI